MKKVISSVQHILRVGLWTQKPLARWAEALKAILDLHIASTFKLAEGFDDSWLFFNNAI
jgi:hypothetical protein